MKAISNPELYRRLSEPFASLKDADVSLNGFIEELYALREKYRIPDLFWVARIAAKTDSGETLAYTRGGMGNQQEWEAMLAHALGCEQAERQARIGELLHTAITGKRDR